MEKTKFYFKFKDGSIAYLENDRPWFNSKPTHYKKTIFGKWKVYK